MTSFKEFYELKEAFDIDNVTYQKSIEYNNILKDLFEKGAVPNHMTYVFEINNIEYIVVKYIKNKFLEFHLFDFTNNNEFKINNTPMSNHNKVFATVLKIIYDNKGKAFGDKIRIYFTKDRERLYSSIFKSIRSKYFPEYTMSVIYHYEDTVIGTEAISIYAFNLTSSINDNNTIHKLKESLKTKINFKDYILEMAQVNTLHKSNSEAFNEEQAWEEQDKNKAKLIKKFDEYSLYSIRYPDERYYLTDTNNKYIASVDYHLDTELDYKHGISIMYGYSNLRGAYRVLLDSILKYTNANFILSDKILSIPASKFWLKYMDEISTSNYYLFLYDTLNNKILPYDKKQAITYDDDISSKYIKIGVSKTKLGE
jgi:hypothetical protein